MIQALDRQALPIACKARRFWVGRLLRFLHRAVEREFSDERWGLIEIAVADPLWPYDEVHDPWPSEASRPVSPYSEVHVLASS